MGIVLGALGDSGYGVAYRVLDAQHFGVPQRRRRVFIVAGRRAGAADSTGPVQVLLEPEGSAGNPAKGEPSRSIITSALTGGIGSRSWAGSASREDQAAPFLSVSGGLRTTDIDGATFVVEQVGGGPRLASSSQMQRVASTVTTGTGQRMDPDTESLVLT